MGNSKSTPCKPKALSPFLLLLGCPQIFVFNSPWIAMFEMQIGFPFTLLYPFSCVRLSVCLSVLANSIWQLNCFDPEHLEK